MAEGDSNTGLIIILVVVVAVLIGIFYMSSSETPPVVNVSKDSATPVPASASSTNSTPASTKGVRHMSEVKGNTRFEGLTSEMDVLLETKSYGNDGCVKQCLDNLECKGYVWHWEAADGNDFAQCTLLKRLGPTGKYSDATGWNAGKIET